LKVLEVPEDLEILVWFLQDLEYPGLKVLEDLENLE
jgi:hypothetical protein